MESLGAPSQPINQIEAESHVERLEAFSPLEVGTKKWMRQHEIIQKLNFQAHYNALHRGDEFIVEALVTHDKLVTLIHELLVIESWMSQAWPHLATAMSSNPLTAYVLVNHEMILCNLLECVLYHKHALQSFAEQPALLSLTDYCHRKIVWLGTIDAEMREAMAEGAEDKLGKAGKVKGLDGRSVVMSFHAATFAVTIARFLLEGLRDMPASVTQRVVSDDFLMALAPLVVQSPWTCKMKGKVYKFKNAQWTVLKPAEWNAITQPEAQIWLAVRELLSEGLLERQTWTPHKKEVVAKMRPCLTDILLDQIPPLMPVRVAIDTLLVQDPPQAPAMVYIEEVHDVHEELMRVNWEHVIEHQRRQVFGNDAMSLEEKQRLVDALASTVDDGASLPAHSCDRCGKPAEKKCSRCKVVFYCSRDCQMKSWKKHKKLCIVADVQGEVSSGPAASGSGKNGSAPAAAQADGWKAAAVPESNNAPSSETHEHDEKLADVGGPAETDFEEID